MKATVLLPNLGLDILDRDGTSLLGSLLRSGAIRLS